VLRLGDTDRFVVPLDPRAAASSLASYNALRPRRARIARRTLSWLARAGLLARLPGRRSGLPDGVLAEWLRESLGVEELRFACGVRPESAFATPVLQLFTPHGRALGYAKLGWDTVTRRQVRTEASALATVAGARAYNAPPVVAAGDVGELAVCVTAPMPATVCRLPRGYAPDARVVRAVAASDGPTTTAPIATSEYARRMADSIARIGAGDAGVLRGVSAAMMDRYGEIEVEFGRWHGDWVPWNMALDGRDLWVWDWEYSAAGVPVGFDALHWHYQLSHVGARAPAGEAMVAAERGARSALDALGLGPGAREAIAALHRLEVRLRAELAVLDGGRREAVCSVDPSFLLAPASPSK
jgi:hypothetical protein